MSASFVHYSEERESQRTYGITVVSTGRNENLWPAIVGGMPGQSEENDEKKEKRIGMDLYSTEIGSPSQLRP
jgi:hypothetical protein